MATPDEPADPTPQETTTPSVAKHPPADTAPVPTSRRRVSAAYQVERSPLISPETLKEYDSVVPGTAKALVDSFVQEGGHRRRQEEESMDAQRERQQADIKLESRAQGIGGSAYGATLVLAGWMTATGNGGLGVGIVVAVTALFSVALLTGRRKQEPVYYPEVLPAELEEEGGDPQSVERGAAEAITDGD